MRTGRVGARCDKCGRILTPIEVIKIKSFQLDLSIDNTGRYKSAGLSIDLCSNCYENHLLKWAEEGR